MKIFKIIENIIKGTKTNDFSAILNDQETEYVSSEEIIRACVKKYRNQYILILFLIIFFEVVMIIRGLMFFDFTKIRRILYMVSYVMLLAFSCVSLFFMILSYKRNKITKGHTKLVYAYCIFLTIWSAAISLLDIYGGHTPIVFMTVIMGTGALAFIKPALYMFIVGPLSALILWFITTFEDSSLLGSGYQINFFVFVVFSFFIISRQFNQNKRDYIVMKKLEQISYHDQLTGLKNRYALHQALDNLNSMFFFGMFDFDNFKTINDSLGHDFGDSALCEVAHLLEDNFQGLAFRYGGDEFVVISTEREDEIIERCLLINKKLKDMYPDINVQLSGGFYLTKSKDETYEDYLKYADRALNKSKTNGKARFTVYKENE